MEEPLIDLPVLELEKLEGGENKGPRDGETALEVKTDRCEFDKIWSMDSASAKLNGIVFLEDEKFDFSVSDISLDSSNETPSGSEHGLASSKTTPRDCNGITTASGDSNSPGEFVFPRPVIKTTPTKSEAPPTSLTSGEKWVLSMLFKDNGLLENLARSPETVDPSVKTGGGAALDGSTEDGPGSVSSGALEERVGGSEEEGRSKELSVCSEQSQVSASSGGSVSVDSSGKSTSTSDELASSSGGSSTSSVNSVSTSSGSGSARSDGSTSGVASKSSGGPMMDRKPLLGVKKEPANLKTGMPKIGATSKLPKMVTAKPAPKRAAPTIKPSLLPRATNKTQKGAIPTQPNKTLPPKTRTQKASVTNGSQAVKTKLLRPAAKNSKGKVVKASDKVEKKNIVPQGAVKSDLVDIEVAPIVESDIATTGTVAEADPLALKSAWIHSTPIDKVKCGGGGGGGGGTVTKKTHSPPKFTPILCADLGNDSHVKQEVVLNKTHSVKHNPNVPKLEMATPKCRAKRKSFIPTPLGAECEAEAKRRVSPIKYERDTVEKPRLLFGRDSATHRDRPKQIGESPDLENRDGAPPSSAPQCVLSKQPASRVPVKPRASGLQRSLRLRAAGRKGSENPGKCAVGPLTAGVRGSGRREAFRPVNGLASRIREKPMKPSYNTHSSYNLDENETIPRAKVMHSPINKENLPDSPHSKWSPIKKKPSLDDSCIRCTKRQKS